MEEDDLAAVVGLVLDDVAEDPAGGVFPVFAGSGFEAVWCGPGLDGYEGAGSVLVVEVEVPGEGLVWWVGPVAVVDVDFVPLELFFVFLGDFLVEDELLAPEELDDDHVEEDGSDALTAGADSPGDGFGREVLRKLGSPVGGGVLEDGAEEADWLGVAGQGRGVFEHSCYGGRKLWKSLRQVSTAFLLRFLTA